MKKTYRVYQMSPLMIFKSVFMGIMMDEVNINGSYDRKYARAFGDSIQMINSLLNCWPNQKINLYALRAWRWKGHWQDLLDIMEEGERITLYDGGGFEEEGSPGFRQGVGTLNKEAEEYQKSIPSDIERFRWGKRPPLSAKDYRKVDWNKIGIPNIDPSEIDSPFITWARRPGPGKKGRILEEPPDYIKKKYKDYKFINLGAESHGDIRSGKYDLKTSVWLIKNSKRYINIDSGGTHLAFMCLPPEKISLIKPEAVFGGVYRMRKIYSGAMVEYEDGKVIPVDDVATIE